MITKCKFQLFERIDEIFCDSSITYNQYNESGNLAKTIDPLGNETNYRYDNLGRKISETNAEGGVTKFVYWHDGQMQSLTDPVGNKTIWIYNLLGRVSREIITLDKKVIARFFYYDANGNIVTKIDRNNRVTSWTYDKLNRPTSEIWHSRWRSFIDNKQPIKKFTTTYNNKGKIESTEDGDNKFTFAYGIFGNEIKQNQNLADLGKPIKFNFVTNINGQKTEKILNVDGKTALS
jgi:YD repeat-containing protein